MNVPLANDSIEKKTTIFFSRNTEPQVKRKILEVVGILDSQHFDMYLGLLALVGKSKMAKFQGIKTQVWKKLQDWKLKFLSQASKEILIKAVIQAIPTYSMSVFLLLKALCNDLNSLMQRFWWGHQSNDNRIH
jgi:aspartokinase